MLEKEIKIAFLREKGRRVFENFSVINEFWIEGFGRRVDLVLASKSLYAFEVKGAEDNLSRLHGQLEIDKIIFDFFSVVCEPRHTEKVRSMAPEQAGIYQITNQSLECLRRPLKNELRPHALLPFLRVVDLRYLAKCAGLSPLPSKRKELIWLVKKTIESKALKQSIIFAIKNFYREATVKLWENINLNNPVDELFPPVFKDCNPLPFSETVLIDGCETDIWKDKIRKMREEDEYFCYCSEPLKNIEEDIPELKKLINYPNRRLYCKGSPGNRRVLASEDEY